MRPMKDRTREAIFNLLGPSVKGMWAVDLFAGTGAMALEALSRGAAGAVLIERHLPTARLIAENIRAVGADAECTVITADAFRWAAEPSPISDRPWVVFCCPPYDFFVDRQQDILHLIETMYQRAPLRSALVVESDDRFDHASLPGTEGWDTRRYLPAHVGILWKE